MREDLLSDSGVASVRHYSERGRFQVSPQCSDHRGRRRGERFHSPTLLGGQFHWALTPGFQEVMEILVLSTIEETTLERNISREATCTKDRTAMGKETHRSLMNPCVLEKKVSLSSLSNIVSTEYAIISNSSGQTSTFFYSNVRIVFV